MSRNADIELEWGGEKRTFRLAWGELEKLQEICNCGPFKMFQDLSNPTVTDARIEQILEVVRWGLIGGGENPAEATKLVNVWVKDRPLTENVLTAQLILAEALYGSEDEPPKK